jgi:phenylalanine ammonia-lyase
MVYQSPQLAKAVELWKLLQIRKKSGTYILDGNSLTVADVVATSLYVNPLIIIDPQRYASNSNHSSPQIWLQATPIPGS